MQNRRSMVSAMSAAGLALSVTAYTAQAQAGPRWQGFLGCWSAVASNASGSAPAGAPPVLCVTPTQDADVIEVSAIADGKVASRDRIDASGRAQAIDAGGCNGSTSARWSDDQQRVFLRSSVNCGGQQSVTSAILAMAGGNGAEWIDVRSVTAGGNSEVRVARYRDIGLPGSIPSEIAAVLRDRDMAVRNARIASTAQIAPRDIIEATRASDPAIVEAWLLESGQRFESDGRTLRELADAGVPGRVTDAMLSTTRSRDADNDERVAERVVQVYDPWGYGYAYRPVPVRYRPVYAYAPSGFSFSLFGFGYAPYGYAYAPFGYYPYAYRPGLHLSLGFGWGYDNRYRTRSYRPPVVVVHGNDRNDRYDRNYGRTAQPRVEQGRGYTEQRSTTNQMPRPTERRYEATPRTATERTREVRHESQPARPSQPSQPSQPRSGGDSRRTAHTRQ
ncbi:MAG: hypothetical protein ABIY52_05650 [Gemmatimonadaceae bacterium]